MKGFKISKKLLMVALGMLFAVVSVYAESDETWEVVGGSKYAENRYWYAKRDVSSGGTIKLLKDIKSSLTISYDNKKYTLDLNGHVIQPGVGKNTVLITEENKNTDFTITDSNKTTVHYFEYSKDGAWTYIELPTEEQKNKAVEINSIDNATTVVKVYGGVVAGLNQGIGLYNKIGNTVTIKNVNIIGNKKSGVQNCGTMIIEDALIVGNENLTGGGIKNTGSLTIDGATTISRNTALLGGGIYNDKTLIINGGSIEHNKAFTTQTGWEAYGGAIYSYCNDTTKETESVVTLNGGTISNNEAERGAGVVAMSDSDGTPISKLIITSDSSVVIKDNVASNGGGGIMLRYGATLEMNNGVIEHNSAVNNGAGIDIGDKCKATITGGNITSNTSYQYGGGISVRDNGSLIMSGGLITNNTASINGGGVCFGEKDKVEHGIKFSDSAVVKDNTSGEDGCKNTNNVYLGTGKTLVLGELNDNGHIGLTLASPGVIFEDFVTDIAELKNYFSDNPYKVIKLIDNEAKLIVCNHKWIYSVDGFSFKAKCKDCIAEKILTVRVDVK